MIAVVVHKLSMLKILHPIMMKLHKANKEYILYYFDGPSGHRKDNKATIENIKRSSGACVKNSHKHVKFSSNDDLVKLTKKDQITKLVSVEIYFWCGDHVYALKRNDVRLYNISHLTDAFWHEDSDPFFIMDRIYYTAKYIKELALEFFDLQEDKNRDRLLGSPLIQYPVKEQNDGENLLIMIPTMKQHHYRTGFAHEEYFEQSIRKLAQKHKLLFKTRSKHWLSPKIVPYAQDIIIDKHKMYPPPTWKAFKRSHTVMLYYSSGIFEAVTAGNYVVNVPISIKRYKEFGHSRDRLRAYLTSKKNTLYNFDGVVESVRLCNIINGRWNLKKRIDPEARQKWIERFIGPVYKDSATEIVKDIISDA